jgi:hypothetical protein
MHPSPPPSSHTNCVGPEASAERARCCRGHHRRPRHDQSSAAAKAHQVRERGRAASRPALGARSQQGCRGRSAFRARYSAGASTPTGWRRPARSSLGGHIRPAWRPKGIRPRTNSRCKSTGPVDHRDSGSRYEAVLPRLRHVARPGQLPYVRHQTAHQVGSSWSPRVLNGATPRAAVGMEPRPFGRPAPGTRSCRRRPR